VVNKPADFIPVSKRLPERGTRVDWITPSGHQVNGGVYDGVWFLPSGTYCYQRPLSWRPSVVTEEERGVSRGG